MKYLVLLALLAYVYYSWRSQRRPGRGRMNGDGAPGGAGAAPRSAGAAAPQEMVACAACGLHLPRDEALADARGRLFCSAQHREQGAA